MTKYKISVNTVTLTQRLRKIIQKSRFETPGRDNQSIIMMIFYAEKN